MSYRIVYTKQAVKDAKHLKNSPLAKKAKKLLKILEKDPFQTPPVYEKLIGDLEGTCSRRLNIQHRIVYQVYEKERVVKVIRLWTHYE